MGDRWGASDVNCCAFSCSSGYCFWSDWTEYDCDDDWEGMGILLEDGTIGMLLDLDEGTLAVYKNGRRLGAMKDRLSSEYCWFTSILNRGCSVSIERGTLP